MLKKLIAILSFCLATHQLIAQEDQLNPESSAIGRYQLSVVANKTGSVTELFLLDTATGTVWMTHEIYHRGSGQWQWLQWSQLPCHSPLSLPPFPDVIPESK